LHISICIVTDSLLESHTFSRSATRACSGIKPEYDGFSAIITEFYFTACVVFDQKIRRDITYCEHYDLLKKFRVLETLEYRQTGRANPVGKEARGRGLEAGGWANQSPVPSPLGWVSGGEPKQTFTAFPVLCILGLVTDN